CQPMDPPRWSQRVQDARIRPRLRWRRGQRSPMHEHESGERLRWRLWGVELLDWKAKYLGRDRPDDSAPGSGGFVRRLVASIGQQPNFMPIDGHQRFSCARKCVAPIFLAAHDVQSVRPPAEHRWERLRLLRICTPESDACAATLRWSCNQ